MKNLKGGLFVGTSINVMFWVLYSSTGNVVASIGITAVFSVVFIETLRRLGKINRT